MTAQAAGDLGKALMANALTIGLMAVALFLASGTPDWWQAWMFLATFTLCALGITADLALRDPALLARRMRGGPFAEGEATQRVIMAVFSLTWIALLVVPGLDRRFGWSEMPVGLSLFGDLLVIAGYAGIGWVFRINSYTAATVRVEEDQHVIQAGPYAHVRHPMYGFAMAMLAGMALALGSWWGLAVFAAMPPMLTWRLLDEERVLRRDLSGYAAYCAKTRWRLVPGLW